MQYKDYYKIMGLERDASKDEVRRAYRQLARKYHPDVSKEPDAEDRFKELGEAYEVLKDEEKRSAYDSLGQAYAGGDQFQPPPEWSTEQFTSEDMGGVSDFFESLFGQSRDRRGAGFNARGRDLQSRVAITLEEAYAGSTQSISLQTPITSADGRVQNRERTLQVKIPAGVTEGQLIRLPAQGEAGIGDGPTGDVFLELVIAPHPYFTVEQKDVYLELPVTPWEAALGVSVSAPTLGGKVSLSIPAGAQSGTRLRLKGRGLPGNRPGDQYVTLRITNPKVQSEEDKMLYKKMAEHFDFDPREGLER